MDTSAWLPVPTPADARAWSRRVPRRALTVCAPVLIVVALAWTIADPGEDAVANADDVASWWWITSAIANGLVVACIPLLVARPHATIGWAALGMLGTLVGPGWATWATVCLVAGVALAALAVADALGASRQRATARSWPVAQAVPGCDERTRAALVRWRALPVILVVVFGMTGVFAVAGWHDADRDNRAFHEVAVPSDGVVVRVAQDTFSADVQLSGGEIVQVPAPATYPAVGDIVVVLTAPGTSRTELASDPADPTDLLAVGSGLLLAALVLLQSEISRRRSARRLLDTGGPVLLLAGVPGRLGWVDLRPLDALAWTITRLPARGDLGPWKPATHAGESLGGFGRPVVQHVEPPTGPDLYGFPTTAGPSAAALDPTRDVQETPSLAPGAVTTVEVHGLLAQGDFPLLRTSDGRWLLPRRPARDDRLRLRRRAPDLELMHPPGRHVAPPAQDGPPFG